ncbi:MAG: conjugative transposon protein TraM [Bacteroidetes bacterium]|nr:conjugative transposon protein TraM [Bacteroidota bacterium]
MEQKKTINQAQRRFYLVLPLIAIPFITLLFWALGGGTSAVAKTGKEHTGINLQLPKAHLQDNPQADKLSFYEQAQKDSMKEQDAEKDDPYFKKTGDAASTDKGAERTDLFSSGVNYSGTGNRATNGLADNEQAINLRLEALKRQVSQPPEKMPSETPATADATQQQLAALQTKLSQQSADDPEMKQINSTLDKLMALEHPELAQQQLQEQSEKSRGTVFPVSSSTDQADNTFFGAPDTAAKRHGLPTANGFYGLDTSSHEDAGNGIAAMVHGTQTLTNGATIKLRLLQDVFINGILVHKDNFIYGTCSLEADRLNIEIKDIRVGHSVYPVSLKAFDLDGLPGIHVPGAITRDAAKDGADQAIQSLDFYSMSPSVGAQAASAGVQAVKGLFSRKVRLIKVTVKSGYSVLLANANQFNQ